MYLKLKKCEKIQGKLFYFKYIQNNNILYLIRYVIISIVKYLSTFLDYEINKHHVYLKIIF